MIGPPTLARDPDASVEAFRLLLVEDDPNDAELVRHAAETSGLVGGWQVVASEPAYRDALAQDLDVILCDHSLPGFSAARALEIRDEMGIATPFIIVSGTLGEERAVEFMRQGAADYLLKDRLARLGPAVRGAVEGRRLADRQRHLEEQLDRFERLESLARLAGGVAHDFNNILAVIVNYTGFIRDAVTAAHGDRNVSLGDVIDDVDEVSRAAERATELVRQLLTFSRNEVVEPSVLNVSEAVGEVVRFLGRTLGEQVTLVTEFPPGLPPVLMDPTQLDQLVINLAVNARDAMPQGGTLAISGRVLTVDRTVTGAVEELQPGEYLCLGVEDTGLGMPPDVRDRMFEPFFTTKGAAGSGLGLATVYGIVRQAGGVIDVETQEGVGTRIQAVLPAARMDLPAEPTPPTPGARVTRVLVVEDDPSVRRLLERLLEGHGYEVRAVGSGREAIDLATADALTVDLLVSDMVLPGMNGVEVAERFRRHLPDLPVLFLSGYADRANADAHPLVTPQTFLRKPFTEGTLLERVVALVGPEPGART